MIDRYLTTYSHGNGGPDHEAIQNPWDDVEAILGRKYDGLPEDDEELIDHLLAAGAPEWVRDADGWIDEHGWGLIGPAAEAHLGD